MLLSSRARSGFALLLSVIAIWIALTPGAAQSKNQKRITALQIGEVSEGSRITIVSDSALHDYEAFRRGDRFYVRIPLADFTAAQPGFRGDGFEDVQVQKVGDSVVVSFKLQPGATARVDQRSNRLDVIFSAPNRMARRNRANAGSDRGAYIPPDGIVRLNNPQSLLRRERDAAGPMPPASPQASRERVVTGRSNNYQTPPSQLALTNPRAGSGRRGINRPAGNMVTSKPGASSTITKSERSSSSPKSGASPTVPRYEASPPAMPSTSPGHPALATSTPAAPISPGYPALATGTPAAPVASQPTVKSPGLAGSQNGKSWTDIARQWVKANPQATWLGALLGLSILVFLAALLFRRRKNVVKAKPAGTALAQPKHSAEVAPNSPSADVLVNSPPSRATSPGLVHENTARSSASELSPVAVPVAPANAPRTSGIHENAYRGKQGTDQARAQSAAVAAPPNHAWVPASSSTGSRQNEDQEREVFEL